MLLIMCLQLLFTFLLRNNKQNKKLLHDTFPRIYKLYILVDVPCYGLLSHVPTQSLLDT